MNMLSDSLRKKDQVFHFSSFQTFRSSILIELYFKIRRIFNLLIAISDKEMTHFVRSYPLICKDTVL